VRERPRTPVLSHGGSSRIVRTLDGVPSLTRDVPGERGWVARTPGPQTMPLSSTIACVDSRVIVAVAVIADLPQRRAAERAFAVASQC
jgi:hypothetical protein